LHPREPSAPKSKKAFGRPVKMFLFMVLIEQQTLPF
jgi:hypothetical protein